MNSEIIALTFKGLRRRFKNILRSMVLVVLAFTFVTGVLLLQENMLKIFVYKATSTIIIKLT